MIILKSNKINRKIKILLEEYKNILNYKTMRCPCCASNNLIRWGKYRRNVYYINNNCIEFDVIDIQRFKCKECNHTHALLPEYIIPYKQFLLDVIINAVSGDSKIDNYNISYDTIVKWNKQFNIFLPYLKTMFSNDSKINILYKLKNNFFKYYEQFYDINKKILMMIKPGIFNMAYF